MFSYPHCWAFETEVRELRTSPWEGNWASPLTLCTNTKTCSFWKSVAHSSGKSLWFKQLVCWLCRTRKKEAFYNLLCVLKCAVWWEYSPKSNHNLGLNYRKHYVITLDNPLSLDCSTLRIFPQVDTFEGCWLKKKSHNMHWPVYQQQSSSHRLDSLLHRPVANNLTTHLEP